MWFLSCRHRESRQVGNDSHSRTRSGQKQMKLTHIPACVFHVFEWNKIMRHENGIILFEAMNIFSSSAFRSWWIMHWKKEHLQPSNVLCRVLLPNRVSVLYPLLQHLHQHQQRWLLSTERAIISESPPSSYHVSGQVNTISQPHRQAAAGEGRRRA